MINVVGLKDTFLVSVKGNVNEFLYPIPSSLSWLIDSYLSANVWPKKIVHIKYTLGTPVSGEYY